MARQSQILKDENAYLITQELMNYQLLIALICTTAIGVWCVFPPSLVLNLCLRHLVVHY